MAKLVFPSYIRKGTDAWTISCLDAGRGVQYMKPLQKDPEPQ
jgi:hypothetical protein